MVFIKPLPLIILGAMLFIVESSCSVKFKLTENSTPQIDTISPTKSVSGVGVAHAYVSWDGLNVNCTDSCKNPEVKSTGTYACSSGDGNWQNGQQSFNDPLPTGDAYLVTSISLDVVGRFNCQQQTMGSDIVFMVQEGPVNFTRGPNFPSGCDCMDCVIHFSVYSAESASGWPGYIYGGSNVLSIILPTGSNVICIDYVNITLNYVAANPNVIAIIPSSGPTSGGTTISIWGSYPGFNSNVHYCCLFSYKQTQISDVCTPATVLDDQHASCTSVPHPAGTVTLRLRVVANGGDINTNQQFTYYATPNLTQLIPSRGYAGQTIFISGINFSNFPSSRLSFGSQIIPAVYMNSSMINATIPPGTGIVFVNFSQNGQQYTQSLEFTYLVPPPTPTPKGDNSSIPGWLWVVLVFGGLTLLVIIILIVSNRCVNRNDDSESQRLLGGNDSTFIKQIDINSVKILHRIGKGTFGEVYKGIWSGTEVGVKFLTPQVINDQFLAEFYKEVTIMRGCRHPNVLQFLGAGMNPPNICIVMEYMPLGSLYRILHDEAIRLDLDMIRKMMIDAARGMNYLHSSNPVIIHRDLKSHNLLVDENWKVKVCDFGLSKILETKNEFTNMTACGTPSWTAPEILRNEPYTEKADIYSFGIVLWECVTRQDPYEGMAPFQVVLNVGTKGMRPTIPVDCPNSWYALMTDCWAEIPDKRPSFDEILTRLENM